MKAARCAGRGEKIAEIIEPAFADRHHLGQRQELLEVVANRRLERRGVMRMYAGGAPEHARLASGEISGRARARKIRAGHHLAGDSGLDGRHDHLIEVRSETRMRQVRPDVDQLVRQEPPPRCVIFGAYRTRG